MAGEDDVCRRLHTDLDSGSYRVCRKALPEGTLPYAAINSGTGKFLMLCADCRAELESVNAEFLAAAVYAERLSGSLTKLREGKLISEEEMREILAEQENPALKSGPLSPQNKVRAVGHKYGEEEGEWLEDRLENPPLPELPQLPSQ